MSHSNPSHYYISPSIYSYPDEIIEKHGSLGNFSSDYSFLELIKIILCYPFICSCVSMSLIDCNLEFYTNQNIGFLTKGYIYSKFSRKMQIFNKYHYFVLFAVIFGFLYLFGIKFLMLIPVMFILIFFREYLCNIIVTKTHELTAYHEKFNKLLYQCELAVKSYKNNVLPFKEDLQNEISQISSTFELFIIELQSTLSIVTKELQRFEHIIFQKFEKNPSCISTHVKYLISISGIKPCSFNYERNPSSISNLNIIHQILNYDFYLNKAIITLIVVFISGIYEEFSIFQFIKFIYYYLLNIYKTVNIFKKCEHHLRSSYILTFKSIYKSSSCRSRELKAMKISGTSTLLMDMEFSILLCSSLVKKLQNLPSTKNEKYLKKLYETISRIKSELRKSQGENILRIKRNKSKKSIKYSLNCQDVLPCIGETIKNEFNDTIPEQTYSCKETEADRSEFMENLSKIKLSSDHVIKTLLS